MTEKAPLKNNEKREVSDYEATTAHGDVGAGDDPDASTDPAEAGANHWFFPFEPFRFIREVSPAKYKYVPTYLRVVQSFPHLVLLVGTIASLCLLVWIFMQYRNWYGTTHTNADILVVVLCFLYAIFCMQQIFKQLVEYSADLQTRAVKLQASKIQVTDNFNRTVAELDTMLNKSADTQASLAERGLDSQRRDFQNFLTRGIARRFAGSVVKIPFEKFVAFLSQYMAIFQECSMDPLDEPFILSTPEELKENCTSVVAAAELVGARAKAKEVKFLSAPVEEAKQKSTGLRRRWKKVTYVPKKVLKLTGLSRFIRKKKRELQEHDEEHGSFGQTQESWTSGDSVAEARELRWFRLDVGCGFGVETTEEEIYPVQVHGHVFTCTVLSKEHVQLLVSVALGLPLLFLSVFAVSDMSRAMVGFILVSLLCVSFVLYDFLEIDAVQRMEIQIQEMQAAVAMVQQRREKMLDFFGRVHFLTDFWRFRTLPRLELMKLFAESLQDAEDAEVANLLIDIVAKVDMIEDAMASLQSWQDGSFSRESKEKVADTINKLSRGHAQQALSQVPSAAKELVELKIAMQTAPASLEEPDCS
mmetsp:Transcript_6351/g.11597  ORF Transcript_6351/g.11597 Transcript_6351/m.11597 type:complete len:587 (+) Transcript_6351:83-1843(+)